MMRTYLILLALLILPPFRTHGQEDAQRPPKPSEQVQDSLPGKPPAHRTAADHVLGPDDQIMIHALDAEEISGRPVLIDTSGYISLPLVGRFRAAGLTVPGLEAELVKRLSTYIMKPQVSVAVVEFRSQPVSVMGAVNNPGVHQVRGEKTLAEMLSMSGGLRPDAGHVVKITRRLEFGPIPLPTAATDATRKYSVAEVSLKSILGAEHPEENIFVKAHDVITVPRAEMVYVIGEVRNSGGFVLNDKESISVLKALSLAGGIQRTAAPHKARILCSAAGGPGQRAEVPVDLRKILDGKSADVPLHAEDILFIPTSASRNVAVRALETIVQTGSGIAIWRSARY